jgi:hypothetical protein
MQWADKIHERPSKPPNLMFQEHQLVAFLSDDPLQETTDGAPTAEQSEPTYPDVSAAEKTAEKSAPSRRQPQREAVCKALSELFPNGVPDAAYLTNNDLVKSVGDRMGARTPGRDTILRAAGRRTR